VYVDVSGDDDVGVYVDVDADGYACVYVDDYVGCWTILCLCLNVYA